MPILDSPQVSRATRSSTKRNSCVTEAPKEKVLNEKPKRSTKRIVIIHASDSEDEEIEQKNIYRNKKISARDKNGDTPKKTVSVDEIAVSKFERNRKNPVDEIIVDRNKRISMCERNGNTPKNAAKNVLVDQTLFENINGKIKSSKKLNVEAHIKYDSRSSNNVGNKNVIHDDDSKSNNNVGNKHDNSDSDSSKKEVLKLREIQNTVRESSPIKTNQNPENSPAKTNSTPRKKKLDIENIEAVTPPKQQKINDVEKKLFSPSSLFSKLDLNASPSKNETHFEPKKLFRQQPTNYQNARKALHSTVPVQMPGREKEHDELRGFIKRHLDNKTSGTLYVSGPPGTGKTASLSTILRQPDIESEFKEVYVNCTAIKSSGAIYSRIVKELGLKCSGKNEKDFVCAIENHLRKNHKMILLVLDEIDQLESKKQSVLYTIFEWPSWPESRLILIGIANALDLTDRILPRLQARCELKPKLMHFAPYTKQQIVTIFTDRLKEAGVLDMFQPVALQMLAGKVAAISGDVRRALDIGRRVIEIVEQRKKTEAENPKSVDLKHVVGVLNSVYGTSNNLNDDAEDSFPLQQKIIICTLLLILRKARNKDVTVGKLHEVYKKVCGKRNLLAVDQAEFVGLCSLIETKGIIRVSGRKEPRLHKVNLEWDDEEVGAALKDKQLMSMILQDDSVLGKM